MAVTRALLNTYADTTVPMSMHNMPKMIPVCTLYFTMACRISGGPITRKSVPGAIFSFTIVSASERTSSAGRQIHPPALVQPHEDAQGLQIGRHQQVHERQGLFQGRKCRGIRKGRLPVAPLQNRKIAEQPVPLSERPADSTDSPPPRPFRCEPIP